MDVFDKINNMIVNLQTISETGNRVLNVFVRNLVDQNSPTVYDRL